MELFATDGVNPTTVIGLLTLVITAILAGVGWAGKRWLGPGGLLEKQTEANQAVAVATAGTNAALESTAKSLEAVADCVRQHDERAARNMEAHISSCIESGARVSTMHEAALVACDMIEQLLERQGVRCEQEINAIRTELKK